MPNGSRYFAGRLIPRANTLDNWVTENPIPKQGEIVMEFGTGLPMKMKIGDGINAYSLLPYIFGGGSGGTGNLQGVLNVGNTAVEGGGNSGTIILIDTGFSPSQSLLLAGSLIQFTDQAGNYDWEQTEQGITAAKDATSATIELNYTNNLKIVNDAGTDIVSVGPLATSVNNTSGGFSKTLSTLAAILDYFQENTGTSDILHTKLLPPASIPSGNHTDTFRLPYKAGVADIVAMLSDIEPLHPSGTPTLTFGPAAGTSPGGSVTGDDRSGIVAFTTGTFPSSTTNAIVFTLNYHSAYSKNTNVFWSVYIDGTSNPLTINNFVRGSGGGTHISTALQLASAGVGLLASTSYIIAYQIIEVL